MWLLKSSFYELVLWTYILGFMGYKNVKFDCIVIKEMIDLDFWKTTEVTDMFTDMDR